MKGSRKGHGTTLYKVQQFPMETNRDKISAHIDNYFIFYIMLSLNNEIIFGFYLPKVLVVTPMNICFRMEDRKRQFHVSSKFKQIKT